MGSEPLWTNGSVAQSANSCWAFSGQCFPFRTPSLFPSGHSFQNAHFLPVASFHGVCSNPLGLEKTLESYSHKRGSCESVIVGFVNSAGHWKSYSQFARFGLGFSTHFA